MSPRLSYERPRYFQLPPAVQDLQYGEEVVDYTARRITSVLVLPALAVIGTTGIFITTCFPATVWHVLSGSVLPVTTTSKKATGGGLHTDGLLAFVRWGVVALAGSAWLAALAFFSVQFAEWRYSVYVVTNVRLVRRFVNFDWAWAGILRRRFETSAKQIALNDIGAVTHGPLDGIQVRGRDSSLLMSITYIPHPAEFLDRIEAVRNAPLPGL